LRPMSIVCHLFRQQSVSTLSTWPLKRLSFTQTHPLLFLRSVNVAQDVDEPWPLEIIGHDGKAYNVTMEPGDMVLYESHSVLHGRPFPLKGRHFRFVVHRQVSDLVAYHGSLLTDYFLILIALSLFISSLWVTRCAIRKRMPSEVILPFPKVSRMPTRGPCIFNNKTKRKRTWRPLQRRPRMSVANRRSNGANNTNLIRTKA
jgi:hypothetical protein